MENISIRMIHPKISLAPSLDIYLSVISDHVLVIPVVILHPVADTKCRLCYIELYYYLEFSGLLMENSS